MPSSLRPSRRGNLFFLVLLVLFVGTVVLGAIQMLRRDTARQIHLLADADESFHRAEAVLEIVMAAWRGTSKPFQNDYGAGTPIESMQGAWDGVPFRVCWAGERGVEGIIRASVWVRFPEGTPKRTWRFDCGLRKPTLLEPRMTRVESVVRDDFEPFDYSGCRQRAIDLAAERAARVSDEPAVEAVTARLFELAARRAPPDQVVAALTDGRSATDAAALKPCLDEVLRARTPLAIETRVAAARNAVALARALPGTLRRRWVDGARWTLACALEMACSGTGGPRDLAYLDEAASVLAEIQAEEPECGAAVVAWRRAQVLVRRRPSLTSVDDFRSAKEVARAQLGQILNRKPREPVNERTCIIREELPRTFELLWKARLCFVRTVAGGVEEIHSQLEDGTAPMRHYQGATPSLTGFGGDGGTLLITPGPGDGGAPYTHELSLDGLLDRPLVQGQIEGLTGPGLTFDQFRAQSVTPMQGGGLLVLGDGWAQNGSWGRFGAIASRDGRQRVIEDWQLASDRAGYVPSPTDGRLARLRMASRSQLTIDVLPDVWSEQSGNPPQRLATLDFPSEVVSSEGWGWQRIQGRDWFAFAAAHADLKRIVYFVDVSQTPPVISTVLLPDQAQYESPNRFDFGGEGPSGFTSNPPGMLVRRLFSGQFEFVPLPGSELPSPRKMPLTPLVSSTYLEARIPPWGDVAYVQGMTGTVSSIHRLDLRSGELTILMSIRSLRQFALSPIPEMTH